MQEVRNGHYGEVKEFSEAALNALMKDHSVEHVEVFPGTEENLIKAKERVGKKFNYKCGGGFKKAPRIKNK